MYQKIIKEICDELNIKYKILSNGWIIMLEKDNIIKYISGYKFDTNNHASSLAVDDKYAMYSILKEKHIKVIEHQLLYDENNFESYAKNLKDRKIVYDYFKNHNNDIVIKSNTGTCGKEVYHVTNELDIDKTLDILFQKNFSLSICPFYNIEEEYRIIMLNGIPKFSYSKQRPVVKGNGQKLISELLQEFNPSYNYKIENDRILSKDETYTYSWRHNLSNGATINRQVKNKCIIENLAKTVTNTLNLKFGSVDIVKINNEYMVLECNSGVMMNNLINILEDGYELAKEIYKEAIILMFTLK